MRAALLASLALALTACAVTPPPQDYELPPGEVEPAPPAGRTAPSPAAPPPGQSSPVGPVSAPAPAASPVQVTVRERVLASGSRLSLPPASKPLPLLVLFPYTGGTAADLLRWNFPQGLQGDYAVLLLTGRGNVADYVSPQAWAATLARYEGVLRADLAELAGIAGLDTRRSVLAGFSLGGDLAWALALRNPQRVSGALIMGARLSYRAADALKTLSNRGVRYYLTMGAQENAARIEGMSAARQQLETARITYQYVEVPGEHVPAPPEVFEQGLYYLFNEPM